jgi:hypothetical protein
MTLRPTTSKATAEAKYSDDNEEMTLRPTTSKATAEAKYYDIGLHIVLLLSWTKRSLFDHFDGIHFCSYHWIY